MFDYCLPGRALDCCFLIYQGSSTRSSSQNVQTSRNCSAAEAKEILVGEESVQAGVGLTSLAHKAGESDDALLASDFAVLVNLEKRVIIASRRI